MFDLLKTWMVISVLQSQTFLAFISATAAFFMLWCGIFVKFKNGWLSWLLYLGSMVVFIAYMSASVSVLEDTPEDLQLNRGRAVYVRCFDSGGFIEKRRLIRYDTETSTRLLGICLSSTDSVELANDQLVEYKKETIVAYSSKLYSGVVLQTASGLCINEDLLSKGIAEASVDSPKLYKQLQEKAKNGNLGIWSLSTEYDCGTVPTPFCRSIGIFIFIFIIWIVFSVFVWIL